MSRIVKKFAQGPEVIKSTENIFICRCGLTKDAQGLCDSSHKLTLDEDKDKIYYYDEKGERKEVLEKCCGGICSKKC